MTWGSSLLVRGKATFGSSAGQSLLRFGMKYKKTCGIGGFAPLRDTRNLVICACRRRLVICACWRLLQIQTHLKLETFITRRGGRPGGWMGAWVGGRVVVGGRAGGWAGGRRVHMQASGWVDGRRGWAGGWVSDNCYELQETKNATWAGYSLVGLLPLPFHPHLAHFFICIGPQLSCRILFCGRPCCVSSISF
jgi:hypothetical protein